jgi:hypothetical protein
LWEGVGTRTSGRVDSFITIQQCVHTTSLQHLRVEAKTTVERLKEESKKIKEDTEKKERLIRALEAEKAILAENKAPSCRIPLIEARFEIDSDCQDQ